MMIMISIVCVFNNAKVLDEYLQKSLKNQTADYELILIDNTDNKYRSASEALNYGAKKAKGNYLMFVHQDVDLYSKNCLENVEDTINSLHKLGVVGIAGKSKEGIITNIKHGIPPTLVSKSKINRPQKVQTLDECLFIVPHTVFNKYKFNEKICDDWHLYSVEYCLNLLKNNYNVYVIPNFIYHASAGYSLSNSYFIVLEKLLRKYKEDYNWIYTTVWNWNTKYSFFWQKKYYQIRLRTSNLRRLIFRKKRYNLN